MKNFIIRKAENRDIDSIIELTKLMADYHNKLSSYWQGGDMVDSDAKGIVFSNQMAAEDKIYLVAEVDTKLVGYFFAEITEHNEPASYEKIGNVKNCFVR